MNVLDIVKHAENKSVYVCESDEKSRDPCNYAYQSFFSS